jgi:glycosyltransferase involved in cell wall biosynthesis
VSAPLKVLYVMHTGSAGGSGGSLMYLLQHFPTGAVTPTVVCPDGPLAARLRALGVPVRPIPGVSMFHSIAGVPLRGPRLLELLRTLWFTRYAPVLHRAIREVRPDVVHLNERGMLHAARLATRAGVPVVLHARSVADRQTRWAHRLWIEGARRYASRVVAIDQSVRHSIRELERVDVIYNPLPAATWATEPGGAAQGASGVTRVAYLTGLSGFKGIWDLLAAARLLRHRRDIHFVIAGGNSRSPEFHRSAPGRLAHLFGFAPDVEQAVRAAVEREGLHETVRLAGQVADPRSVLRDADLLVFPSHLNGPGRSVFEAGVLGIPAVVALRDPVDDIVADGETGLVVPERNPARLAEAITRLADDPVLRARLGACARERYCAQFAPARAAAGVLAVYRELALPRAAPPVRPERPAPAHT